QKPTKNSRTKAIAPVPLPLKVLDFSENGKEHTPRILHRATAVANDNNPELRTKNMKIQSAQRLSKTEYELPKNKVNFQYGNNEGFEYNDGFQISQTIPFPTLFGAKKNLVKEQVKGQQWAKALTENELKKQVRTYYYQLEYLEH